jgi:hypothetical protein
MYRALLSLSHTQTLFPIFFSYIYIYKYLFQKEDPTPLPTGDFCLPPPPPATEALVFAFPAVFAFSVVVDELLGFVAVDFLGTAVDFLIPPPPSPLPPVEEVAVFFFLVAAAPAPAVEVLVDLLPTFGVVLGEGFGDVFGDGFFLTGDTFLDLVPPLDNVFLFGAFGS